MDTVELRDAAEYAVWEVSNALAEAEAALTRFQSSIDFSRQADHINPTAVNPAGAGGRENPTSLPRPPVPTFGVLVRACAWCGCLLGMETRAGRTEISHGICPRCADQQMRGK
jgi:hypothetical protein